MKAITTDKLLEGMASVGLPLLRAAQGAGNLYIWTSRGGSSEGHPIYIGKSTDVRRRRVRNETGWAEGFDRLRLADSSRSVIATTLAVHEAHAIELTWDAAKIDLAKMRTAYSSSGLTGEPAKKIEYLLGESPPWAIPVGLMEKLLIRAVLHTGTVIANSQYASQWEGPIGEETDALGRLVALVSGHLDERFPKGKQS